MSTLDDIEHGAEQVGKIASIVGGIISAIWRWREKKAADCHQGAVTAVAKAVADGKADAERIARAKLAATAAKLTAVQAGMEAAAKALAAKGVARVVKKLGP